MTGPRTVPTETGVPLDAALRRARAGADSGFLELYTELQPRLLRYLRSRAAAGPEDVAAETWLHVVRDLRTFRGDGHDFRRWLFTLARHRAVDAARHSAVRPVLLLPDVGVVDDAAAASAEDVALEQLSTDQALALLATLPAAQADMVALRVLADLDVATVAEIVGRSPGVVRVGVHRALRQLAGRAPLDSQEVLS